LSKVAPDDLERVFQWREQRRYNSTRPYKPEGELPNVDLLLGKLQLIRPFTLLKQDVQTNGDFPSTYQIRICEFV
jgi:hypothetical protein